MSDLTMALMLIPAAAGLLALCWMITAFHDGYDWGRRGGFSRCADLWGRSSLWPLARWGYGRGERAKRLDEEWAQRRIDEEAQRRVDRATLLEEEE